mgnify:CR=1 FL=1
MDAQNFLDTFKEALEIEDHEVNWDDKFRDYEEWDSLNQMSLVAYLDETYEVSIETKDLEKLETVKDLYNEVENRMNHKQE